MAFPTDKAKRPAELLDEKLAVRLSLVKISDREAVKVAYLIRNCYIRTVADLLSACGRSGSEFSDWILNNEGPRRFKMPTAADFERAVKIVSIVASRLRFGTSGVDVVANPLPAPKPAKCLHLKALCGMRPQRRPANRVIRSGKTVLSRLPSLRIASSKRVSEGVTRVRRASPRPRKVSLAKRLSVSRNRRRVCGSTSSSAKAPIPSNIVPTKGAGCIAPLAPKKGNYIRRSVYMASRTKTVGTDIVPPNREGVSLRAIFPPPLRKLKCPWRTALLFRDAPGFFRYAEDNKVSSDALEACIRLAIGKRRVAERSQTKEAGFARAFVVFAPDRKGLFYGNESLFMLVEYLTLLQARGPSVPAVARRAFKVYGEILCLVSPRQHPDAIAASGRNRSLAPRPVTQAPMLDFQLIPDLERLAIDKGRPMGGALLRERFPINGFRLLAIFGLQSSVRHMAQWERSVWTAHRPYVEVEARYYVGNTLQWILFQRRMARPFIWYMEILPHIQGGVMRYTVFLMIFGS